MSDDDSMRLVSSELQLTRPASFSDVAVISPDHRLSALLFTRPSWMTTMTSESGPAVTSLADSDGDLVVPRRRRRGDESDSSLIVEHRTETALEDVGKQLWKGALLLADLLLHEPQLVRGKVKERTTTQQIIVYRTFI
jgi:hypothetical protein